MSQSLTYVRERNPNAQDGCANDGKNPMLVGFSCPPSAKQSTGNNQSSKYEQMHAMLGFRLSVYLLQVLCQPVRKEARNQQAGKGSDTWSDIRKADFARREVVLFFEQDWYGGKEKVEVAIEQQHECRDEEYDWRTNEHFRWSNDRRNECPLRRASLVKDGAKILIASRLAKPVSFSAENGIGICFAHKSQGENEDGTSLDFGVRVQRELGIKTRHTSIVTSQKDHLQPSSWIR